MNNFVLVLRKVVELIPYDRNSRTHNEAQVAQLAASIKEFGFTNPVLIDEQNTIIAGEGRVLAAKKVGLEEVPCIVLTGLTEVQKAAYVIADNKLGLNSGWNTDLLLKELERITDLDLDMSLMGFDEVEVLNLLDQAHIDLDTMVGDQAPHDWSGMPEFDQPNDKPFRTIIVHMNDQAAVDAFAKAIGHRVTDKTKYLWYPELIKVATSGAVYA